MIRVLNNFSFGPQLEPVEHGGGGVFHTLLHQADVLVDSFEGAENHHRVVDWCTNFHSCLHSLTATQAQHFGTVGLHVKIAGASGVWPLRVCE